MQFGFLISRFLEVAISLYVYSNYYLYYFGYSVYSLLHFTGILLALSGVLEYESNNER